MDVPIIYVYIPCRLDNEIIPTVKDLFEKSSNPQNIKVVIFNQDIPDKSFTQLDFPEEYNILLINVDYNKFTNICRIRSLAKSYVEPSFQYYLGIDSHMRFDPNWDLTLINALNNYPNKSILSAYPPSYTLENGLDSNTIHFTNKFNIPKQGNFPFVSYHSNKTQDYRISTIAGGFHFSKIKWLYEVGYDPLLNFRYEEVDLTYRSIEQNYDIVNYKDTPMYHLYDHSNRKLDDHQEEILINNCTEYMLKKFNPYPIEILNQKYNINFLEYFNTI